LFKAITDSSLNVNDEYEQETSNSNISTRLDSTIVRQSLYQKFGDGWTGPKMKGGMTHEARITQVIKTYNQSFNSLWNPEKFKRPLTAKTKIS